MVFQVLINYNMRNELLDVADSLERFENTRVWDLRWRIASKIFEQTHQLYIKLIFGNDLLEDHRTLGFYNITHLSVLMVVLRMPGGGAYQVLVNYNDKKLEVLDVANSFEGFNSTTISRLKLKFTSSVPGAPFLQHVRLIFGNDLLEDDQTLRSYKLTHLSVLMVVMRMPGGGGDKHVHQVLIYFNDKKKPLDVADSEEEFNKTTVLELKEKCRSSYPEESPKDPGNWRVIFGGNRLEDHQTLGFYRIRHLSCLFFFQKLPGGGEGLPPPKEVIPRTESMERLMLSM